MAMFNIIQSTILNKPGKYDKFQLPFLHNYNGVIYFIGTQFNHNVIRGGIELCHQCVHACRHAVAASWKPFVVEHAHAGSELQ